MSQYRLVNRVFAGIAFLAALVTYTMTLQPSVPFWDCGEFSAAAAWQQVPHPPGAPLWLIVAKLFHMLPGGDPGWRINMVSAVCSALCVMLAYLISVQIIERWRPFREGKSIAAYITTFGGALIGALAFTWSDTNWFNSVESEVYAAGNLLIALLIWLMMLWDRNHDKPGHERYILLMSYIVGLSFGVHLLALLVIPAIAMVIYFRKYKFSVPSFLALMAITAAAFYVIYNAPLSWIPKLLANYAGAGLILLTALIGLVAWAGKEKKSLLYTTTLSLLLIILGFTSYTQILLRASAHPVMNENEPDTFTELTSYLGREQYGSRPNWPRRIDSDPYHAARMRQYGDGTWVPPEYRNGELVSQQTELDGELDYMFSYQIYHMYGRYFFWNFVGRVSDVQDAGVAFTGISPQERTEYITSTGYSDVFPIQFFALPFLLGLVGLFYHYKKDWKMAFTFTALFLLLGVLATLQQNQQEPQPRERDYFYVGSFMIYAMWIGIGGTGLAETVMKKRKEDTDDTETALPTMNTDSPAIAVPVLILGICFLLAPVNMAIGGWKLHDRSGNWLPWDYAYNLLQSCEQDGILFTNGDNDTFPLWYIQDVGGVRRDVRVVNLELAQTRWYLLQMKNERPWGAKKIPLTFPDEMLALPEGSPGSLYPELGDPQMLRLDVPAAAMAKATDGVVNTPGTMVWNYRGEPYGKDGKLLFNVKHQIVRNILEANKWERPIYFSITTSNDVWSGLQEYFRWEGMAFKIMPVRQGPGTSENFPIDIDIMKQCLINTLPADEYHTEPHYGFKFRGLNDPNAYFMGQDDHRRPMNHHYRPLYLSYANYLLSVKNDSAGAVQALDKLEELIPSNKFGSLYPFQDVYVHTSQVADMYYHAGAKDKAKEFAARTLAKLQEIGNTWTIPAGAQDPSFDPTRTRARMLTYSGQFDEALQVYQAAVQMNPQNAELRVEFDEARIQQLLDKGDTEGAAKELRRAVSSYSTDNQRYVLERLQLRFGNLISQYGIAADNTVGADTGVTAQ